MERATNKPMTNPIKSDLFIQPAPALFIFLPLRRIRETVSIKGCNLPHSQFLLQPLIHTTELLRIDPISWDMAKSLFVTWGLLSC